MTENIENIVKIDIASFADMCEQICELTKENDFLKRQNNALKIRCSKYAIENRELSTEVSELRFTNKCLLSEEGGA